MNTKKALSILSRGKQEYGITGSELESRKDQYIAEFDAREADIVSKKNRDSAPMPFLKSIKDKVSKLVNKPDDNLPVITKFDLYTGVKAVKKDKDNGLKQLVANLERVWHADPMGTMTYGDIAGLVKTFKGTFPRSVAGKSIENTCSKLGFHKLPVAKLARLASKITSQDDYDSLIEVNGLAGNRPEQVRGRALVRGLVALSGRDVSGDEQDEVDVRTATDRVVDKLASLDKQSDYTYAVSLMNDASTLAATLEQLLDQAANEMHSDGLEDVGQQLQTLSSELNKWMGGLTDARDQSQMVTDEQMTPQQPQAPAQPGQDDVPFAEDEDVEQVSQPAPWGELGKSLEKQDVSDAGMKKKWYDPRTWSMGGSRKLLASVRTTSELFDSGVLKDHLDEFARVLEGQVMPMMNPKGPPMPPPGGPEMPPDPGLDDMPMDLDGPMEEEPEQLSDAVDLITDVENMVMEEAPPDLEPYFMHEQDEGHSAPPGTAEWGAEEILNEGHTAPPPSDEWLAEEAEELDGGLPGEGMDDLDMPPAPAGPPGPPMPPPGKPPVGLMGSKKGQNQYMQDGTRVHGPDQFAKKPPNPGFRAPVKNVMPIENDEGRQMQQEVFDGKRPAPTPATPQENDWSGVANKEADGIPTPDGKPKAQPKVTTYMKDLPADGGKVLKSAEIEEKLLSGKTVKFGHLSIRINRNDDVELWNKDAGRACGLEHIDTAIADFVAMVEDVRRPKYAFNCMVEDVVPVPCEQCSKVMVFTAVVDEDDAYVCECGHQIPSVFVAQLGKLGYNQKLCEVRLQYPLFKNKQAETANLRKVISVVKQVIPKDATIEAIDKGNISNVTGQVVLAVWNASAAEINDKLSPLANYDSFKHAQMGGGPGGINPPAAPPGGAGGAPGVAASAPISEIIQSALQHYHNMGMAYLPSVSQLRKDYKEREAEFDTPEAGQLVMQVGMQLWGAAAAPAAQPGGAPVPGDGGSPTPPPASMPVASKTVEAQGKMEIPSIRKPKDHVKVDKDLGEDSEGKDLLPSPGKIKSQPNKKQPGKLSPTDLGEDSEGKDLLPMPPGEPKAEHPPTDQKGVKLPKKKLDKDLSLKDPFPTPGLGSVPSVKKS